METFTPTHIATRRLTDSFGAEIREFDASAPVDERTARDLADALYEHQLLVFRDQQLTPEQHLAFTRCFGTVHDYPPPAGHPDYPGIVRFTNATATGAEYWHSDGLFFPEPPSISLLYGVELPPEGGDTLFVNAYAAYETLPDALKDRIDGCRMLHENDVVHPMVRTHPVTGRKALYVDLMIYKRQIVGMASKEKEELLRALRTHIERPELGYRHRWVAGDLVVWDNASTLHQATETPPQYTRIMHRTPVRGTVPV